MAAQELTALGGATKVIPHASTATQNGTGKGRFQSCLNVCCKTLCLQSVEDILADRQTSAVRPSDSI